ncbi:hypothetical protein AGABI2DRAFT_71274 [Agaricus bisporus var. bisporus H97]|uniref:hypothetical protein n=1 Tax=Agaricus bisporus var. bisporus (strain H97 / ATCC MYA-4626 / FGSC 10389) TaxID=936046 RepID=UPI00029F64C1|nr:hypothetical protein AGABI2DRAFT_71274 [Agaricus bisporus var. bisporus H97]EKV46499.1 hypothetical protein AGABI2DRAFT_71274 [Agaricus bisporus var. bisporus H97]
MSAGGASSSSRVSGLPSSTPKAPPLVPTNHVTTLEGVTVRARIDPTLTVDDVLKQLCSSLKKEPASDFALRDESDELVTNDNLRKKIKGRVGLKLVKSPSRQAADTVEELQTREENDGKLRMALFELQKFIREEQFVQEFLKYGGLHMLVNHISIASRNSLAYALTSMQNLMDFDYGWGSLDDNFILRVVQILSSSQSPINVCRPATVILKKLVEADPLSAPGTLASTSKGPPALPPGSVYRYGFQVVFNQMKKERGLLGTVVDRLGSADTAMAQYSMMLINSLLSHANDDGWEEFVAELEQLNIRQAFIRSMSLHTIEDLTSCILDFQANMVRVTYRKKTTLVDPEHVPAHNDALSYIWNNSQLEVDEDDLGGIVQWRKLGFESEDIVQEFSEVGVLGLDYFYRVHFLATRFFLRMWGESGAAIGDFQRVLDLVQSQVKVALRSESVRPWREVEQEFNQSDYRAVRDRQMKELELEDDLLNKVPVRNLRAKLYKESYEFVRQQRIQCLLQGAWFVIALPQNAPREVVRRPKRPWRFMRLDSGLKYLHYVDSAVKFPVRSGLEDLPDRIDVSLINDIATGTCAPPPNVLRGDDDLPPAGVLSPSPLSFSLLNAHEGSLVDLIAPDQSRWADWTDGLNMLRKDGGHAPSTETSSFVQALTEIGLKIKLLDLSGEMVEIPTNLTAGPPPTDTNFFFSESLL